MLKKPAAAEIKRLFEWVSSSLNRDKRTGPGMHAEPVATGFIGVRSASWAWYWSVEVWVSLWNRIWGHKLELYLKVSLFSSISIDPCTLSSSFKELSGCFLSFFCISSSDDLFSHHSVEDVHAHRIKYFLAVTITFLSFSISLGLSLGLK